MYKLIAIDLDGTLLNSYGEITDMTEEMPTLTFNTIGRHISRMVRTKVVSAASPWAMDPSVVDDRNHFVAISHGEGRIVISECLFTKPKKQTLMKIFNSEILLGQ